MKTLEALPIKKEGAGGRRQLSAVTAAWPGGDRLPKRDYSSEARKSCSLPGGTEPGGRLLSPTSVFLGSGSTTVRNFFLTKQICWGTSAPKLITCPENPLLDHFT